MNKKIKKLLAGILIASVACVSVVVNAPFKSKADGVKYERDNHLGVDENGDLVITRNDLGNTPMGKEDSWTIFVYLCGSDLETGSESATTDIKEMIEAGVSDNVNIVIQTGGACEWQNYDIKSDEIGRYEVEEDSLKLVESLPDASMSEVSTLADFVSWGVENYPAEHMGMIYWNHGGGSIDGACYDEKFDGMLTLSEFEKAMSIGTKNMTDKFEFVGFDACLMATIETANTFVPYADYIIASEEVESCDGWEYTSIVNKLVENPDIDGETLGKVIIDSFIEANIEAGDNTATLSMVDLSKMDNVLKQFNVVARKIYELSDNKEDMSLITKLAHMSESYYESTMLDLGDFLLNLSELIPEAEETLKLLEEAIIYEKHGSDWLDTLGITLYYSFGDMDMRSLNIYRNICISPYFMNFIEKLEYGNNVSKDLEGFKSNNWECNEYYYEETYDFIDYEFEYEEEYFDEYYKLDYFKEATFDDMWAKMYSGLEYDEDMIDIDEDIDKKINVEKDTVSNSLSVEDLKEISDASYKLVIDNGTSMKLLGDLGSIEEKVKLNGTWFALNNGSLIEAEKLNEGNGLTMYRTKVLVDEKENYIYFVTDKKQKVMILGIWSGIDEKTKASGRMMKEIEDGAEVAPVYTVIDYTTGKVSKEYGQKTQAVNDLIKVVDVDLNSFAIEMRDAYDNVTYSTPIN